MSLQYQVKDLEGLDEAVQTLYEKTDDGYRLKVEGIPQEDVSGLKSANPDGCTIVRSCSARSSAGSGDRCAYEARPRLRFELRMHMSSIMR